MLKRLGLQSLFRMLKPFKTGRLLYHRMGMEQCDKCSELPYCPC
jgi:hypothetical protein